MSSISNTSTARLKQDYLRLKRDPVPYVTATPLPNNILIWHYVVKGPENTPYYGGIYQGKLVFPKEFPFKPPSIYMITPNGRFKINQKLCLSISDYHPESWNPSWSVNTILTGLLSFMLENTPTTGALETSDSVKRRLAYESLEYNLNDKQFCELFPEIVEEIHEKLKINKKESEPETPQIVAPVPPSIDQNQNWLLGLFGNVFVIFGLAAFAFVVKYVLTNVN